MPTYHFTPGQRAALRDMAPEAYNPAGKVPRWQSDERDADVIPKEQKQIAGVTVDVYAGRNEPAGIASVKLECVKKAIEGLQSAGIMFADADVQEFRVVLYASETSRINGLPSRGVVWFDDDTAPKPVVMLQLGTRIMTHVMAGGSDGAGDATGSPPRIVADRIYDYYKKTLTGAPVERSILAQIYHEFGHIFHQLTGPAGYGLGADLVAGIGAGATGSLEHQFWHRSVPTARSIGKKYVSEYSGNGQLNEFVAEVFSGLMMGVDWNAVSPNVMGLYRELSGPTARPTKTLSRMKDFITQKCRCDGAYQTRTGEGAKIYFTRM